MSQQLSITVELATRQHREVLQSLSAQMSLLSSILNPWVYCGLSRPYRRAYIYVLRRVGRVCGVAQASQEDIAQIGDASSRFRTSSKCYICKNSLTRFLLTKILVLIMCFNRASLVSSSNIISEPQSEGNEHNFHSMARNY